jgi:uncharacterized membrane protein
MDPHDGLSRTVHENLEALLEYRRRMDRRLGWNERLANALTRRIGTMAFAWTHLAVIGGWVLWNTLPGLPVPRFDPYPFVLLAVAASVEAIFLSTFVLVAQQLMSEQEDRRAELGVQIGLLSEREITRLLAMVSAIARRLEVPDTAPDVADLARDLHPQEILQQIEDVREEESHDHHHHKVTG